jgi:hypothetical protein
MAGNFANRVLLRLSCFAVKKDVISPGQDQFFADHCPEMVDQYSYCKAH